MLEIGSTIGGIYKVLHVLGEGGMSTVYLVMNIRANKQWAAKEILKETVSEKQSVSQNLLAESNILMQLHHPNLPSIVDILDTGDAYVLIMDYVEGKTLRNKMLEDGLPSQEDVVKWSLQICSVFQYLHSQDPPIVYRDTKPSNIMVRPNGDAVLIDFGTAREFKEGKTEDTTCLGTRGYAAPEQFGYKAQTDPRTDIFNLGATMYHLLTGHSPAKPPYEILPIRHWNAGLSSGLEEIILKCTRNNPDERYQSAAELAYDLRNYRSLDFTELKKAKRHFALFAATAICGAACLVASALFAGRADTEQSRSYDSLLKAASMSESYEEKRDNISKAIRLEPTRPDGYMALLDDAMLGDGNFTRTESDDLLKITGYKETQASGSNIDQLRTNKEAYDLFNYNCGLAYFYYYEGSGNKSLAKPWFEEAKASETLSSSQKERAERFYKIAEYYQKLSQTDKAGDSTISYKDYWNDLRFITTGDIVSEDNVRTAMVMYKEFLYQIGIHADDFFKAGVSVQEMADELDTIESHIASDINEASFATEDEYAEEFAGLESSMSLARSTLAALGSVQKEVPAS